MFRDLSIIKVGQLGGENLLWFPSDFLDSWWPKHICQPAKDVYYVASLHNSTINFQYFCNAIVLIHFFIIIKLTYGGGGEFFLFLFLYKCNLITFLKFEMFLIC